MASSQTTEGDFDPDFQRLSLEVEYNRFKETACRLAQTRPWARKYLPNDWVVEKFADVSADSRDGIPGGATAVGSDITNRGGQVRQSSGSLIASQDDNLAFMNESQSFQSTPVPVLSKPCQSETVPARSRMGASFSSHFQMGAASPGPSISNSGSKKETAKLLLTQWLGADSQVSATSIKDDYKERPTISRTRATNISDRRESPVPRMPIASTYDKRYSPTPTMSVASSSTSRPPVPRTPMASAGRRPSSPVHRTLLATSYRSRSISPVHNMHRTNSYNKRFNSPGRRMPMANTYKRRPDSSPYNMPLTNALERRSPSPVFTMPVASAYQRRLPPPAPTTSMATGKEEGAKLLLNQWLRVGSESPSTTSTSLPKKRRASALIPSTPTLTANKKKKEESQVPNTSVPKTSEEKSRQREPSRRKPLLCIIPDCGYVDKWLMPHALDNHLPRAYQVGPFEKTETELKALTKAVMTLCYLCLGQRDWETAWDQMTFYLKSVTISRGVNESMRAVASSLAEYTDWPAPSKFSLTPVNSVLLLGHWLVAFEVVARLDEPKRQLFASLKFNNLIGGPHLKIGLKSIIIMKGKAKHKKKKNKKKIIPQGFSENIYTEAGRKEAEQSALALSVVSASTPECEASDLAAALL